MLSHTLRAVLFLFPVRVLVDVLLLWGGYRAVRDREFGRQVFLAALSIAWFWVQLRHDLVV